MTIQNNLDLIDKSQIFKFIDTKIIENAKKYCEQHPAHILKETRIYVAYGSQYKIHEIINTLGEGTSFDEYEKSEMCNIIYKHQDTKRLIGIIYYMSIDRSGKYLDLSIDDNNRKCPDKNLWVYYIGCNNGLVDNKDSPIDLEDISDYVYTMLNSNN